MSIISGMAGAVTLGGGAVNGKILKWTASTKSKLLEKTGAGDTHVERIALVEDWEIEIEMAAPDANAWDQHHDLVGTSAAVVLKRKSADTTAFATGTGLVEEATTDAPAEDAITTRIRVVCKGSALTMGTTLNV